MKPDVDVRKYAVVMWALGRVRGKLYSVVFGEPNGIREVLDATSLAALGKRFGYSESALAIDTSEFLTSEETFVEPTETEMTVSLKQLLYIRMLEHTLPWIRNVQTWSFWRRFRDRSARLESELVHNLTKGLAYARVGDHDIWFLNNQARVYVERGSAGLSPCYANNVAIIGELFRLVPSELRTELEWAGPNVGAS